MIVDRRTEHTEHGDRTTALGNEILRTVVGSGVHGIAIAGTDDRDEMGVFVEPPEIALGIVERVQHYVWRTQPEGAPSGPGDTDLVMYGLRKYLRLATKGNPTALLPLFAPGSDVLVITPLGEELRALAPKVLSQHAVRRFLGFMDGQRKRLSDTADGNFNRKQASHALRLALQGLEVARDGRLTLPMPLAERERVLRIKRGDVVQLGAVLSEIGAVQAEVEQVLDLGRSPLPADPDVAAVTAWCVSAYQRHWRDQPT